MEDEHEDYRTLYQIRVRDDDGTWRVWHWRMIKRVAEMMFRHREWEIVPGSGLTLPDPPASEKPERE